MFSAGVAASLADKAPTYGWRAREFAPSAPDEDCLDQFLAFAFNPMALEGGFGDRGRRPPRGENQMVAFGVAWDAVLLAAQAAEAPAVH